MDGRGAEKTRGNGDQYKHWMLPEPQEQVVLVIVLLSDKLITIRKTFVFLKHRRLIPPMPKNIDLLFTNNISTQMD